MRIVVYGIGAIGGCVAGALARSGQEVVGIARGAQLDAIRARGLSLIGVEERFEARFPCVAHPGELTVRPDDVILLCMKSQHTAGALADLRAAGVTDQPIFCCQNGVANEAMAARLFPNVHGVTVLMPNVFLTPGVIGMRGHPRFGVFELGRYPHGHDADDTRLAEALTQANVAAFVMDDVMAGKYGKLLMNVTNIIDAALGPGQRGGALGDRVRAEARAVYAAAGIAVRDVGTSDPRRHTHLKVGDLPGVAHVGSSTAQSLARDGAAGIETDWLNGEIVLLGRQHGVPTPVNLALSRLSARLVHENRPAGSMTEAELMALLG